MFVFLKSDVCDAKKSTVFGRSPCMVIHAQVDWLLIDLSPEFDLS